MSALRAVYVGLAALIALAVWFVAKTRDPAQPETRENPPKALTRQQELFEARNRIRRQIEAFKTAPQAYAYGPSAREPELKELEALLHDIEAELNIFGPAEADAGQA